MKADIQEWYTTQTWYKFRQKIFKRDEYKCKDCKSTKDLRVHHIERAIVKPDLFFEEKNCVTLCDNCHKDRHAMAQERYVYHEDGFWGMNPNDRVLCDCGRFYHDAKYRICYECNLEMKKRHDY